MFIQTEIVCLKEKNEVELSSECNCSIYMLAEEEEWQVVYSLEWGKHMFCDHFHLGSNALTHPTVLITVAKILSFHLEGDPQCLSSKLKPS